MFRGRAHICASRWSARFEATSRTLVCGRHQSSLLAQLQAGSVGSHGRHARVHCRRLPSHLRRAFHLRPVADVVAGQEDLARDPALKRGLVAAASWLLKGCACGQRWIQTSSTTLRISGKTLRQVRMNVSRISASLAFELDSRGARTRIQHDRAARPSGPGPRRTFAWLKNIVNEPDQV